MRHQTHKPRRGGSQAFACPVCAKKFKRADHYRSHIQERHEHSLQGAPLWNLDHDDAAAEGFCTPKGHALGHLISFMWIYGAVDMARLNNFEACFQTWHCGSRT